MGLKLATERMPDGHDRLHLGENRPLSCPMDWEVSITNRPVEVEHEQLRMLTTGEITDLCPECYPTARRIPPALVGHLQHLRQYEAADPATITDAETVHVVKDLIRAVHALNWRIAHDDD